MTFDKFHREHVAQAWREWNPPKDLPKWESGAHFIAFVRKMYESQNRVEKMIEPYWTSKDGRHVIYCGDCKVIIPTLKVGLICITDQPYGTGWVRGGKRAGEFKAEHVQEDWDVLDFSWVNCFKGLKRVASFCPTSKCEYFCSILNYPAVLYYIKSNAMPKAINREPIVVSPPPSLKKEWKKVAYNGDAEFHPCQKPNTIMDWLIDLLSEPDEIVIDPFMGSGTTGVSCVRLGRKFIGIEISKEYCDIAIERIKRELSQPRLEL